MTGTFSEFTKKILVDDLGNTGEDIYSRVIAKKPINEKSNLDDIAEFVKTVQNVVSAVSDPEKANEIGLILRNKLKELENSTTEKEKTVKLNSEIEDFLKKHELPTDADIADFAKYLTMKFGANIKSVETTLIEKAQASFRESITGNRLKEEMDIFLKKSPNPEKADLDDFVNYLFFLKLGSSVNMLREQIEKERLFRKFRGSQGALDPSEINKFIDLLKTNNNQEAVSKIIQKQGVTYLIKDGTGVSGKLLAELVELTTPGKNSANDKPAEKPPQK